MENYKVIWSNQAFEDILKIESYLATFSSTYANSFSTMIIEKGNSLSSFPRRGRVIIELNRDDFRELIIKEYRLMYHILDNQRIEIFAIHPCSLPMSSGLKYFE